MSYKINKRVAIVTGSGRGIGLEVATELAEKDYQVVITSPDPIKAKEVSGKLQDQGLDAVFHKLDVVSDEDILSLRKFVLDKFGRIDVLVNNAGVMFDLGRSKVEGLIRERFKSIPKKRDYGEGLGVFGVDLEIVRATLEINTLGPLRMCQVFVPLMMRSGYGRVVNVSSSLGQLNDMTDEDKVPAYQLSKTALNAVTRMFADAASGRNVLINSVCPGWTRTDIGGNDAPQSLAQAAKTIVWLATLPNKGPTGGFFKDKKSISW